MRSDARLLLSLAPLLLLSPALAQGSKVSSAVELARQADKLKPGDWVWAPEIAPKGPVMVYVDLAAQIATVYRNGVRVGVSTVSSGKPGHETPTGVFSILQKDPRHRSSTYNNAPMPYQERLTWDGVALHAGGLPGYPESHGCVHLPMEFSRLLFGTTTLGGTVVIAGKAGAAVHGTSAGVLDPAGPGGATDHAPLAPTEPYRWTPELSPSGPMTIILSRSDGRAVVLRNGIEIGRARIELPDRDFETHVLAYAGTDAAGPQWTYLPVPGHVGDAGKPLDISILSQARMPAKFHEAALGAIVPGTTVLVTMAPVLPTSTGRNLTVLASRDDE